MDAAKVDMDCSNELTMGTLHAVANLATPPVHEEHLQSHTTNSMPPPSSLKKKKSKANNQVSQDSNSSPSADVSNCYLFKSRLQEYAQKAGLTTPVYQTIKEGPSHEPTFRSSVILNNVRYDSLPGFFNRRASEHSAAEVALTELAKSADMKFGISQPVEETGLCKNLLQEYSQKMNFAMPMYRCTRNETTHGKKVTYSCTVEVGGINYIGPSASTKREAEIKAARIALVAIEYASGPPPGDSANKSSTYTVIPQKKKATDLGISTPETVAALKPKKGRFKKQKRNRKPFVKGAKKGRSSTAGNLEASGVSDADRSRFGVSGQLEGQVVGEMKVSNGSAIETHGEQAGSGKSG